MIRDKDKIYAEVNDPNTVTAGRSLLEGTMIVGTGNRGIKSYIPDELPALIYVKDGVVKSLSFKNVRNKLISVDENGDLVFVDIPESVVPIVR